MYLHVRISNMCSYVYGRNNNSNNYRADRTSGRFTAVGQLAPGVRLYVMRECARQRLIIFPNNDDDDKFMRT